jgi:dTDP-4-dehydrorhamnose 3,5-epimerase
MKLISFKINGPKLVKNKLFKDKRGFLKEIYKNNFLKKEKFIFDLMSCSKKNVLRGLHIQVKKTQSKIITVTHGKIYDVAVDLRKNSRTFGKYIGLTISDKDDFSFYIPKGFAHGFLCLSKECTVYYRASNYRYPRAERTLSWDDKTINIKWPTKKPILSVKDKKGLSLSHFELTHK